MTLFVDPSVAYSGSAVVVDGNTVAAVKAAYNQAAQRFDKSRTAVLIEVLVRVAPRPLDFESDEPLKTCPFGAYIESCDSCQ